MFRKLLRALSVAAITITAACGGSGITDLNFPAADLANTTTSAVSAQVLNLNGGVPAGRRITFLGDEITMRGQNFRPDMRVYFGVNLPIQRRLNSLFTTPRHLLPNAPLVYIDPVTGMQTTTEVGVSVEFSTADDVIVSVPPAVACTNALTNPTLRLYGEDGSGFPATDVLHVVGPVAIALTPNKIPDVGGDSVIVHGDFFSIYTQIAFRYTRPSDGVVVVIGADAATDIPEIFIDRQTLVIPDFPGIVPNSKLGLAKALKVDILVFENIEEITSNASLEPALGGKGACSGLRQQSTEIPLVENGVRNSEKADALTFLPTGVTDYPSIAGIVPEWGSEVGGNTVVLHGDQFDGFTIDLDTNPARPGIRIECPPNSGTYIAPLAATLVDRQTIVLRMPPCPIEIPGKVNFGLANKFSIDNPAVGNPAPLPGTSESNGSGIVDRDSVIFDDVYEYRPIPPIVAPFVTAIHPASDTLEINTGHGYGLQKFFVVGDWFDGNTELNGGFEFVLPDGEVVQSLRTVLRNRNLLEVYTRRLPDSLYPLAGPIEATVRVRNVVGHRDQDEPFTFIPLPDADATPALTELFGTGGPSEGGNQIMVIGANFDTTTRVLFSGLEASRVQYVNPGLLIATVPSEDMVSQLLGNVSIGMADVTVEDDGEAGIGSEEYSYGEEIAGAALGALDPNTGSSTGGYDILAYGVDLSPLTRIEFGVGDGNFSPTVYFLSSNLIRIEVPEAFDAQIGATVDVGATDPLNGLENPLRTVEFTYTAAQQAAPEILFVSTTVVDPINPTNGVPALNVTGGDRMLIIGRNFDQRTTFDITKPRDSDPANKADCTSVDVLTPNIAVCVSPASPDGNPGLADLRARNDFGSSEPFLVEYVKPGPPNIIDVRNLDTGDQSAPIDARDRLLIFGDNFFDPITVRLTGIDLNNNTETLTVTLDGSDVTRVEDHLLGINIPANTFAEGALGIEVETAYGSVAFNDTGGDPIFQLVGPQPPRVLEVFESLFNSGGGQEAIFFGRNFTTTTEFTVRTEPQTSPTWKPVLGPRFVNSEVVIFTMPPLPGGMPPAGLPGSVRAEERDSVLANKITGDPFTVADEVFTVVNDNGAVLLGVFPDRGSIDGGEQVLLFGANFLKATGESNVDAIRFTDADLGEIGSYTLALPGELPLTPNDKGKYVVLNDHEILLITNTRAAIEATQTEAPATVAVESQEGASFLTNGYVYQNTPAVITPFLLGITPNETRLNGGTSHLVSGGFLTHVDKLVFTRPSDSTTLEIAAADFDMVADEFLVFVMPDLTAKFAPGDVLDLQAFKTLPDSSVLSSNILRAAITVTFAGPPTIGTLGISPAIGTAFGGNVVEITGTLFTGNSQVLFGTIPARTIVVASPTRLLAVAPHLPVTAPAPGVALNNIDTADGTVDVAVFTQGGWAVVNDGYVFNSTKPVVTTCSPELFNAGETKTVTITGQNFVPGETSVTAASGLINPLTIVVRGFDSLSFQYVAPVYGPTEVGPKTDEITVSTNMGVAVKKCEFTINLPAFLTSASTSWAANDSASPTTGVADGALIEVTLKGGNLVAGGTLTLQRGGTTDPIDLDEVTGPFTAGGQWKAATDGLTLTFTAPNIFSADTPTLLEGNRNVGPVSVEYQNNLGLAELSDAFDFVPAVMDFKVFSFTAPSLEPVASSLDKLAAGDINADGVPDVVILARQSIDVQWNNKLTDSDGIVFMADTFGAGVDIDGDGVTPDFAGTYTKTVIANDKFRTYLYFGGFGSTPRLANLDDDDQLEIILPGNDGDVPALLIVDVKSDGTLGTEYNITPTSTDSTTSVAGIAVGNFDDTTDGVDIAILVGSKNNATHRKFVFFASTATDFVFTDSDIALGTGLGGRSAGFLESGDFDGDGDDDLIFGLDEAFISPIVVCKVDAGLGTITSQDKLTNLTGGVSSIVTLDLDGDDEAEAFVLVEDEAAGSLVGPDRAQGGVAVILNPFDLKADQYVLTGFIRNGRALAAGELNGDGLPDLAVTSNQGEFVVLEGLAAGKFSDPSRSWTVPTVSGFWSSRVHGLAAADMNRDGLIEVFTGDIGINPMSLIVWLNTSR